jgi:hypothetical protein
MLGARSNQRVICLYMELRKAAMDMTRLNGLARSHGATVRSEWLETRGKYPSDSSGGILELAFILIASAG